MTTKTTKTILFAAAFAIFATSMLMIAPTTLQVQAAQADTLSVTEQNAISTSIKSYEIMNLKPND